MTVELNLDVANNATWAYGPIALIDPDTNAALALPMTTRVRMQLRANAADQNVAFELSLENGRLVLIDQNAATVRISVTAASISAVSAGTYAYDIVVTQPSGRAIRTHEGTVAVKQGVTR